MTDYTTFYDDYPDGFAPHEMSGLQMNSGDYRWEIMPDELHTLEFFGVFGIITGDESSSAPPTSNTMYPARVQDLEYPARNTELQISPSRSS